MPCSVRLDRTGGADMSAISSVATTQQISVNRTGPLGDTIWSLAACRGPHQEIFFPPTVTETRRAKRRREARAKEICHTCAIEDTCLGIALKRKEQHGIWGGYTAKERRVVLVSLKG